MNSIDTFTPALIPLLDSEEGITAPNAAPDEAALEALRALIGDLTPPPPPASAFRVQSFGGDSTVSPRPLAASLPMVLDQLLKSDGLPPALVPLLTTLRDHLQNGGTAKSDPALVAELKTLLRDVVPLPPGSEHSGTHSIAQPVKLAVLGNPAETATSAGVSPAPGPPLSGQAITHAGPRSPAAFTGETPPTRDTTPARGTSWPGLPSADAARPSSAMSGVLPVVELPMMAGSPELPQDLPALAQALLQVLDDTPETAPGSMMMPSFASLIEDETTPPQESPADTSNLGSTILQSLGHQSTPAASVQPNDRTTPASAVARVSEVSNLITQMADRVLVTDPLHGQTQEVRIKIADSVMQDTEVRVWREDGGALRVEFDTTSAYWSRILHDASPLLSQRLNERLPPGTEAQVTVTVQQQGQQPEDGRSRNRQNPWELAQRAQES